MKKQSFGAALGALIKQKRTILGLTQLQMSEDAYQSPSKVRRISELESGTVANPHPKTIDPLIVALKISDEELTQCMRASDFQPDADLEDAYRNASNLIDALLYQFEHDNPDASFGEVDAFLKAKARDWRELRDRIQTLEGAEIELTRLKDNATAALEQGDFGAADGYLEQAEALCQTEHTLSEIRKLAAIRIARGDVKLLSGDRLGAYDAYAGAADFFCAFDVDESVMTLDVVANRIYEAGRRSFDSHFQVALDLLAKATEIRLDQGNEQSAAQFNYKAALITRNQSIKESRDKASDLIDRAIRLNREAKAVLVRGEDAFFATTTRINLGNCLMDKANSSGVRQGSSILTRPLRYLKKCWRKKGLNRISLNSHATPATISERRISQNPKTTISRRSTPHSNHFGVRQHSAHRPISPTFGLRLTSIPATFWRACLISTRTLMRRRSCAYKQLLPIAPLSKSIRCLSFPFSTATPNMDWRRYYRLTPWRCRTN